MKAAVYEKYGSPEVLEIRDVKKPEPGDDQLLVRIHAANVASEDCTFRSGESKAARMYTGLTKPKYKILGQDFAGEVEAVGKNVKRFKTGDRIYGPSGEHFGAHAQYICLNENAALARIPDSASCEDVAALSGGLLTALPFLRDLGRIKKGDKILINGASGSVGTSAVQIAKYYGAEITGVCSSANIDLIKSLGAHNAVDYTKEDFTAAGKEYDIVFDAVGKSSFSKCRNIVKKGGIYLTTVPTFSNMITMLRSKLFGSKKGRVGFTGLRKPADKSRDLEFLNQIIEENKIDPVIDKIYPLEDIREAHEYVGRGHKKGNVVVRLWRIDPV